MKRKLKKLNFWFRRRSHIPLLVIGSLVVFLLFFNEETSWTLSLKYDREIASLMSQIESCRDSASYYRAQREAITHDRVDLEHVARERFHMQRPTEDVYIIKYE